MLIDHQAWKRTNRGSLVCPPLCSESHSPVAMRSGISTELATRLAVYAIWRRGLVEIWKRSATSPESLTYALGRWASSLRIHSLLIFFLFAFLELARQAETNERTLAASPSNPKEPAGWVIHHLWTPSPWLLLSLLLVFIALVTKWNQISQKHSGCDSLLSPNGFICLESPFSEHY